MGACFCIHTQEVGIVETFGKFDEIQEPGCHYLCCHRNLTGRVSLRLQMASFFVDSKTSDNTLVRVAVAIHYRVLREFVQEAFYRLLNPTEQIRSFASNVIRGQVTKHTIDEVFLLREEMQKALREELEQRLRDLGYMIVATLITEIDPSNDVKNAMSQINANARLREAAGYEADTEKIKMVKAAEADAEAKRLSGVGLAEQRKAAILGLQSSVKSFSENVEGVSDKDIMALLMMNQYFDAIKDISSTGRNSVVFLPSATPSSADATQGLMAAMAAQR